MSVRKLRIIAIGLLVVLAAAGATKAGAQGNRKQVIVRSSPEDLEKVRVKHNATVLNARSGYYLLAVSSTTDPRSIEATPGKGPIHAAENSRLQLPERPRGLRASTDSGSTSTTLSGWVDYYGAKAPRVYVEQPAAVKIQLSDALTFATGRRIVVSIIDTGIDPNHPLLKDVLVAGWNYIVSSTNTSEWNDPLVSQSQAQAMDVSQSQAQAMDVSQSQAHAMDVSQSQAHAMDVNQSQAHAMDVNQSQAQAMDVSGIKTIYVLNDQLARALTTDSGLPPLLGHGTMVAGLVHLAAPEALLMPMKAFKSDGSGTLWDVVQAIHDSTDMGARVINMSFSGTQSSNILEDAIGYAKSRGVMMVGAAGNDNRENPTYPASVEPVVGIAAVNNQDQKADFSNYGRYVDLSVPGVDLVTAFLNDSYALVSGTSFSAPLVSAVFTLLRERGITGSDARQKIQGSSDPINPPPQYRDKLGPGRLNASKAVR